MKNILVANLAGVRVERDGSYRHFVKAGSRWPMTVGFSKSVDYYPFPFWLAYTTALLKRDVKANIKGLDGVVLDMTPDEFFDRVETENPDILITELTTVTLEDDIPLLKRIKEKIGCRIIVCGYYASVFTKDVLEQNSFLDYLVFGEYEFTVKELMEYIVKDNLQSADLARVKGLTFRDDQGEVIQNQPRPLLENLEDLPFPDREDFPATIYPDFTLYSPCINIVASRGCPAGCIYCTERHIMYNSPKYRIRKAKKVVEEMELCINKYGARQFYFDDQSFVVNKKYVLEICDEIIRKKITVPWTCMGDAMFVDYETLARMKKAGCIGMKFGIESANPEILKAIHKPLKLEKAKEVVKWCKELGIQTHATFCLALPGETVETIKKSMAFMDELDADTFQVSKAIPYPGTPMYTWAKKNGYLNSDNFGDFDGTGKAILNYPNLSSEELDHWYEIFSKKVSRQKLWKHVSNPRQSFSIIKVMYQQKGLHSILSSIKTFVKRAV